MSSKTRNFYEILNVDAHATFDELKANYKQLILQCHPDKLQKDVARDGATTVVDPNAMVTVDFVTITEAWQTLKDPAKRKLYDAELLLTKFQMHSNIFERLTLADMQRHQIIDSDADNDDNDDEDIVADTEKSKTGSAETEKTKSTQSWYYTYDCRCGGQYIIDESANNEIFKHSTTTTPTPTNSKDNGDDDNEGGDGGGGEGGVSVVDRPTSVESTDGDRRTDAANTATATADNTETEIIVECNECSLVIVLLVASPSPPSWRR